MSALAIDVPGRGPRARAAYSIRAGDSRWRGVVSGSLARAEPQRSFAQPKTLPSAKRVAGAVVLLLSTAVWARPAAVPPAVAAFDAGTVSQPALVARAQAASCAVRQLRLRRPVAVRPLATYDASYTAGVGSVTWSGDHAETWRAGWCAIGVYCVPPPSAAPLGGGASRYATPRGLYNPLEETLYLRAGTEGSQLVATVAHEMVHALQYQNYPELNAAHLWFNRDLSTAVDAVVEGDAHVVGWWFEPERRLHLCSLDPAVAARTHRSWWRWQPHSVTALEGFPHVFGVELALDRLLRGNTLAVDRLLRDPPLSTLAVLRPSNVAAVEFVKLPGRLAEALGKRKRCARGLENTVGAVGIWGILAQFEGGAAVDELPAFLNDWAGDRFAHLRCDGDGNDELAWLTRWRSQDAAREFARRFQAVAAAAAERGGLLAAPARAIVRSRSVLVATPGLAARRRAFFESEARAFNSYRAWIDSGCFPQPRCHMPPRASAPDAGAFACDAAADQPAAFSDWLERVRQARARAGELWEQPLEAALTEAGRLAVFCAVSGRRNADLQATCRAVNFALRYVADLQDNPHWSLLPLCASGDELRDRLRAALARSDTATAELRIAAVVAVAAVFAKAGGAGLREYAAAPPLSTLQLLDDSYGGAVELLELPPAALAARDCEVLATDVVGVWGLWQRLRAAAPTSRPFDPLPKILRKWRGDRQWLVRCGATTGWVWASRWEDAAAAEAFAGTFAGIARAEQGDVESAPPVLVARGRSIWVVAAALAPMAEFLRASVVAGAFSTVEAWRAADCAPQSGCATRTPNRHGDAPATPQ